LVKEDSMPGRVFRQMDLVWWDFATYLERWLPWRWTQAIRHGPYHVMRRPKGYPVPRWIDPPGTPSPMRFTDPPERIAPETAGTRRARALAHLAALADAETPGKPS
jgi:hypothetical protein